MLMLIPIPIPMPMPTPVWVSMVSMGPLVVVFCAVGVFFRFRARSAPFARTEGVVVPSQDSHLGWVIRFRDTTGAETEGRLIGWRAAPRLGARVPIVYDTRDPRVVTLEGPLTNGTLFFMLAAPILLVGVAVAAVAVLTGSR